jgi:transposase
VGSIRHDLPKLRKLLARYGEQASMHGVYEAGPTGYGLRRTLTQCGYRYEVIAPSLIP